MAKVQGSSYSFMPQKKSDYDMNLHILVITKLHYAHIFY